MQLNTTNNVNIDITLAPITQRALALVIDGAAMIIYGLTSSAILVSNYVSTPLWDVVVVLNYALCVCYPMLCEWLTHGQTLGKKITGIHIMRVDGSSVTFIECMLRWVLLPIDLVMGLVVICFNARHQRLGDLAAGTMVVSTIGDYIGYMRPTYHTANPTYQVTYPEAIKLNYHQAHVIERLLSTRNEAAIPLIESLSTKIQDLLYITPQPGHHTLNDFLDTVLNDYRYLTALQDTPNDSPLPPNT